MRKLTKLWILLLLLGIGFWGCEKGLQEEPSAIVNGTVYYRDADTITTVTKIIVGRDTTVIIGEDSVIVGPDTITVGPDTTLITIIYSLQGVNVIGTLTTEGSSSGSATTDSKGDYRIYCYFGGEFTETGFDYYTSATLTLKYWYAGKSYTPDELKLGIGDVIPMPDIYSDMFEEE